MRGCCEAEQVTMAGYVSGDGCVVHLGDAGAAGGGAARCEASADGEAVVLVKPQFEAGREHVGKGGIVRDPEAHRLAVERVRVAWRSWAGRRLR